MSAQVVGLTSRSRKPGYDTKLVQKASYVAPGVTHEVTDIARLRVATGRLRADGYVVMDGGCCPSCNWAHIDEHYADAVNVVHFNDQSLDGAFGEIEPTPEWRGYLDGAGDNEDESENRFEEWLDRWDDDEHPAAQRPGMLSRSLWVQHDGDAARAVEHARRRARRGLGRRQGQGHRGQAEGAAGGGVMRREKRASEPRA